MFLNRHNIPNWKYFIGEILLIFVGIQLSLLFSNFIEERKRKDEEVKIIKEIRDNLKHDSIDVAQFLDFKRLLVRSDSALISRLDQNLEFDRVAMRLSYSFLAGGWVEQDRSAYEALKSQGIDLVSNDSLRQKLTSYYELTASEVKSIQLEGNEIRVDGIRILSNYLKHYSGVGEPVVVSDFNGLKKDTKLRYYMSLMLNYNVMNVDYFQNVLVMICSFLSELDQEVLRLEK